MKSSLIVALLFSIAAAIRPDWDNDWKTYKGRYGKNYLTLAEDGARRQIWEITRIAIINHNKDAAAGLKSYTMSLNALSDLRSSELARLTGYKAGKTARDMVNEVIESKLLNRQIPPTSLDLRTDPCMPAVKNQGGCGSCYAFAAITPLEFALCKNSSNLTTLSEQQIVDCSKQFGNGGCNGGLYTSAWRYVKAAPGEASSAAYNYTAKAGRCRYSTSMSVGTVATFGNVQRNAAAIQVALTTYGPLAVAFQVLTSFNSYSSGVYADPRCPNDTTTANHAVVMVGYGMANSTTPYWIIRNSWGSNWGMGGYFFIQRGVNMCNIESIVNYATI